MANLRTLQDLTPQSQKRLDNAVAAHRDRINVQRETIKASLTGGHSIKNPAPVAAQRVTTQAQRSAERAEQIKNARHAAEAEAKAIADAQKSK